MEPSPSPLEPFARQLAALASRNRLRSLKPRAGADFSSNDYLGLANAPRIKAAIANALDRGVGVGSTGSRLLRGNDPEHEALEAEAARFFRAESALFFSGGYAANEAILSALPQRGDLIVYDDLVHASTHDGMRLSRADVAPAAHNDANAVEDAIRGWRLGGARGRPWISVESLYSMEGDQAPLNDLVEIADRHDAFLVVDEAHATGVFGPDGRGLAAHLDGRENVIAMRTCGKALGCEGALVLAPTVLRELMINRARPFIFATAPSPLMAAAVREALRILEDEPERRATLHQRAAQAAERLAHHGVVATGTQILPLILKEDARTMRVAAALQARGLDVRGVRPPTVPVGTSRLRISVTLNVELADLDALAEALDEALVSPPAA